MTVLTDRLNEHLVGDQNTGPAVVARLRSPTRSSDTGADGFNVETESRANFAVGQPFFGHWRPVTWGKQG
jgi:hypothetical protein